MEIDRIADARAISGGDQLILASKMSAKVDSAAVQDGYELYHHSFFFSEAGQWCVVQQGMNDFNQYARRYHWLGEGVADFVCEPHNAIADLAAQNPKQEPNGQYLLNMVAQEAAPNRHGSVELIQGNPDKLLQSLRKLTEGPSLFAPAAHPVLPSEVNLPRLEKIVRTVHERFPQDFQTLLGSPGVGAATVRSLSLLAELIYDAPASHRDPADKVRNPPKSERQWADYSYAHGGKDAHPFPVDRRTFDQNIAILTDAVRKARVGDGEKVAALKRLAQHEADVA